MPNLVVLLNPHLGYKAFHASPKDISPKVNVTA